MKKVFTAILAFAMLLSLCACGKKGDSDPTTNPTDMTATTDTTGGTEATAGNATEGTQGTDATNATEATEAEGTTATNTTEAASEPTVAPTVAPTACSHTYTDATCTTPKTCSKCGATEGSAKEHSYVEGVCSVCGGTQENYKALDSGNWVGQQVVNGKMYDISLSFKDSFFSVGYGADINASDFDATFRDQLMQDYTQNKNALTVIDGAYYYVGMGDGGDITFTVNGNSIEVSCDSWLNLSLTRTAGNQLTITKSNMNGEPSGIVLTWQE